MSIADRLKELRKSKILLKKNYLKIPEYLCNQSLIMKLAAVNLTVERWPH